MSVEVDLPDVGIGRGRRYKLLVQDDLGGAVNITGWEIYHTVKRRASDLDSAALLKVDTVPGADGQDDPVNGIVFVVVVPSASGLVPAGRHVYDFTRRIVGGAEDSTTLQQGRVRYSTSVTQRTTLGA